MDDYQKYLDRAKILHSKGVKSTADFLRILDEETDKEIATLKTDKQELLAALNTVLEYMPPQAALLIVANAKYQQVGKIARKHGAK